ncbi:barstar family protein [Bacillus sp. EAC]|uniref:barstar family protein n=1 Tax=Bacillus sp. EAC TaxID=1978338 RepID=UPI000B450F26|nr:barstar family protein [Bacillus sp. EAC]
MIKAKPKLLLKEKLSFPNFYGENWDAFWDAITGLVNLLTRLEFIGWSELERRLPNDLVILKEYLIEQHNQEFPYRKCEIFFH